MGSWLHGLRVGVGLVLGVLFLGSILAAVIFDLTVVTDMGPLTAVWLALVVAGHIVLGVAVLYGWYGYLRRPREPEAV